MYLRKVTKKECGCLLSGLFWRLSPEGFELQKSYLPFLASVFEKLSAEKRIFEIEAQNQLILCNTLIFQEKASH